ncbi:MAG: STAS domain-containing protein [Bacteroidota bacterium]
MSETKQFEIQHKSVEDIDCLYLSGYLDAHTAPQLENALEGLISKGQKKIIVNFRELDYISSAGLGVFMAFIEDIRETGGDIKLANMRPKVFSVFELLGFPILFDIVHDEKNAIENFGRMISQNNV